MFTCKNKELPRNLFFKSDFFAISGNGCSQAKLRILKLSALGLLKQTYEKEFCGARKQSNFAWLLLVAADLIQISSFKTTEREVLNRIKRRFMIFINTVQFFKSVF